MASLFTPESERIRATQKKQDTNAPAPTGLNKSPGLQTLKGEKPGDSLGNPNSPGYESWGKKPQNKEEEGGSTSKEPAGKIIETRTQGPEVIRLAFGWDTILFAQKKICEKAKGLFTRIEGPGKYSKQKKSKLLLLKSRGCILDLDLQKTHDQLKEAQAKLGDSKKDPA